MPSADKVDAMNIKDGKLTKSESDKQLVFGESRISKKDWNKAATKCKGEAAMIADLKVSDDRTKK